MKRTRPGTYETTSAGGERVEAYVPTPLPPTPRLALDGTARNTVDAALLALGRLDGISSVLPDTHLLLCTYVRKEAVLSSQIEGTQSTLSDLLLFEIKEAPGVPLDDVTEVSNYAALWSTASSGALGDLGRDARWPTLRIILLRPSCWWTIREDPCDHEC